MKPYFLPSLTFAVFLWQCASAFASGNDPWAQSYKLEQGGLYAQAAAVLDPLVARQPPHEFALLRHAWLNYLQGSHNEAVHKYTAALKVNPRSLDARLGLTLPLLAQQRWGEAAYHAKQVLAVSPWDYLANVRLMICEEGERKWEDLAKHAAEVALRYPADATVLVYLARAEAWLGHAGKAKTAYLQVLERIPGHVEATNFLKRNP
ncbi:MAG: hypothetical protein HY039_08765 [Nitrospirae bacterium]|nr:hypothetical protein [Nitrospirota bacterium]